MKAAGTQVFFSAGTRDNRSECGMCNPDFGKILEHAGPSERKHFTLSPGIEEPPARSVRDEIVLAVSISGD